MKIQAYKPHWHESTSHHLYTEHQSVDRWPWWKWFELHPVNCQVQDRRVSSWNIWLYVRRPGNPAWCWPLAIDCR